jgi:GTP-binding protein LepA
MEQKQIRNFSIIAHIDHGKSTLSDRLLEMTGTVEQRKMQEQVLDSMDLEREKGITIKLAPARMKYNDHTLNLIDTPGHVDFNYEVSRSLAAVEGAVLLVDATQGVQAQTVGNLYLALEQDLEIIPVLNKIDLPAADVEARTEELVDLIGCEPDEIIAVSAKTGENVEAVLDAVVERVPAPSGDPAAATRALVFDSQYNDYKGVVAYVRVLDGSLEERDDIKMMATDAKGEVLELGALTPGGQVKLEELETGQIGVVVTGLKDIQSCRVGDTITDRKNGADEPLPGYKEATPMVFAGIFPKDGDDLNKLRDAMERLSLNDAALTYDGDHSPALGYGFRVGLLGMLHLEILKERLQREFDIDIVVTVPSVAYRVYKTGEDDYETIRSPLELPERNKLDKVEEPWAKVDIIVPAEYVGKVMQLCEEKRGEYQTTEYLSNGERAILHYEVPLAMLIVDFYDKLKSVTSGYASMNYEIVDYREADVVRMDILVAEEPEEAFASLVYRDEAEQVGRQIVKTLKEAIPQQMFKVKLQAAVGSNIVAAERIPALRKDVTAKLYGGDVTRKRKLLEKQKEGKKRMQKEGSVDIPSDAYMKVLKRD